MSEFNDKEITLFYQAALELVEKAGDLVKEAIEDRDKKISEKLSPTDLVTETDQAVENLLVTGLK